MKLFKKALKILGKILLVILLVTAFLLLYLTMSEYRPKAVEPAFGNETINENKVDKNIFTIMSFNTGYAALDAAQDFFMDGGSGVMPVASREIHANLQGIMNVMTKNPADIYFLQEVDSDSKRSFNIDERAFYEEKLQLASSYALNYSCVYVPYPFPTIGKVNSGLLTLSSYVGEKAERIALPSPFSWPLSIANLKRCLLVDYLPIEGSEHFLVLCNLHLEAYDNGEGRLAQTKMLKEFMQAEYDKGNFVIAGGDFNQNFPGALEAFPIKNDSLWAPGFLNDESLPEGWKFAYDIKTPSCRLLNKPLDITDPDTQYYVIDGFILSPNVRLVSVKTLDEGFLYADHNPVLISVSLQ